MGHGYRISAQNILESEGAQRTLRRPLAAIVCGALVVGAFGACSSSTSPANVTDAAISTDLAGSAAGVVGSAVLGFAQEDSGSGASGSVVLPHGFRAGLARSEASACGNPHFAVFATFPGATNRDTLSATLWWSFFAHGSCQGSFVAGSTDSVVFADTAALALNGPQGEFHAHFDVARKHWVTGHPTLHTDTVHTWNGAATGVDTSSFVHGHSAWNYTASAVDTASQVVFAHPRNGDNYPHRGTFTRWVSGTVVAAGATSSTKNFQRHILVTFVGGATAQLRFLDPGAGAVVLTCTLDLANDRIVPGSCH